MENKDTIIKRTPTQNDLARMYYELAKMGARCIGTCRRWPYPNMDQHALLALAAEMSRHDPRLFGILVEYFIEKYLDINPTKLRGYYPLMMTPQVFGVISEFMRAVCSDPEALFYATYLSTGLKPVPTQFFSHNIYKVGGGLARRATEAGISEYKKWGFLASERPTIDMGERVYMGSLEIQSRLNVLRQLLKKKGVIQISDYLKALGCPISRQQALADIKNSGLAKKVGRGRGARWKIAA